MIVSLICGKCGAELGKVFEHPPGPKTATARGLCMECWNKLVRLEDRELIARKASA